MPLHRARAGLVLLATLVGACDPQVPVGGSAPDAAALLTDLVRVSVEPAGALDAAPPVLRIRLASATIPLDPAHAVLLEDPVGPGQLREIAHDELSAALSKRLVPVLTWRDGDAIIVAPKAPLAPGQLYTVVAGDPPAATELTIVNDDPLPVVPRVWPPEGHSGTQSYAVWCADHPLPALDLPAKTDPDGPSGRLRRGAVAAAGGVQCVRFESTGDPTPAERLPPLGLPGPGGALAMRLDPRPLKVDAAPAPVPPLPCTPDEVPFGPGCARVVDDRILGRSPAVPLLWAIAGAGADQVFAAAPGDPFVVAPLPPDTAVVLDVAAIDTGGQVLRSLFRAQTLAPRPHVVLNEVLANPLGPEPAQEWVELVNDGSAPAELGGYTLTDSGGTTVLPAATLDPGAFALVVNDAYSQGDQLDPSPAPGTLILRVPHLGKGGLSNAGEPLALHDANGAVLSTFPAAPKPKAGESVARRSPAAPDEVVGSFIVATPTPGRTNVW